MQISTRSKENKSNNTSHLKSTSEINIVNPERPNAYIQTLMKQNGPMKHLNENFKEIPSPIMVSNIHSIFSSDERRKQIMTMVKKMREKQNNSSNKKMLENYGSIPLSPNPYLVEMHSKKGMQKSSSVTKAYDDTHYNLNNNDEKNIDNKKNKNNLIDYKKYIKQNSNDILNNRKEINDNININIINVKNNNKNNSYQIDRKKNKGNQALYFTKNNEIYNENQINNYDNVLKSNDSKNSNNHVYQKKNVRGEKRHLTPVLNSNNIIINNDNKEQTKDEIFNDEYYEIESFKINIINKKKKRKITTDSFYFAIKPKKKYKKKINTEYKIQSNNFNLEKKNYKNQFKNDNDLYTGIKIIQFDNGENVYELKLNGSIKLINQKLKEEGITINDKEFKIFDEYMLKQEKEKAIEEALNVQENLLNKNDIINDKEKEKNFELEKEEAIKNALNKQKKLFKNEKEELIKLNENKIINALEEQKKNFQQNNLKEKEYYKEKEEELKNLKDEYKKLSEKIELLQKTLEEREINFFNEKNEAIKNALKEQENKLLNNEKEKIEKLMYDFKLKQDEEINKIKNEEKEIINKKDNNEIKTEENNNKNDEKNLNSQKQDSVFQKEKEDAIQNALNKQKELLQKEFELELKIKMKEMKKENENKLQIEIENALKKQKDEYKREKEKEIKKENEIKEILNNKDEEFLKDKNITIQKIMDENGKMNEKKNIKDDNKIIHNSNSFSILNKRKEKPNLIIDKKEKVEFINNGNNKNDKQLSFKDKLIIENKENIEFVNNHNIICNNNLLFSFKKENEFGGSISIRYDDQEVENSDNKNNDNIKIPFKNEISEFEEKIKEKEKLNSEKKTNKIIQSMQIPSGNIRKMIKILEEEKERLKTENPYKLTEEVIKEDEEELNNTSYPSLIKRANTFFQPIVEGLINKKPTINHKKKKPKSSKFGQILLSESMEINNEMLQDELRKKSMQLRMKLKNKKK